MKILLRDELDVCWCYDTNEMRFYGIEAEKKDPVGNGYQINSLRDLLDYVSGENSVVPFSPHRVIPFFRRVLKYYRTRADGKGHYIHI
jgi:hypothetical protein